MPVQDQIKKIENAFVYHAPKADQADRYVAIRERAKDLALFLVRECPESRELSLALTKLEESVMWANSSIARHE